jgi:hypothetical protein
MPNTETRNYKMGYTEKEFSTVLNGAFTGGKSIFNCSVISNNNWQIFAESSDLNISIMVEQLAPRILGAMTLPVLDVTFSVNSNKEDSEKFFEKFFKYFHKGGG